MKMSVMQKMLACILIPVILGLCAVTGVNYSAARNALQRQIAEEMALVVQGQKGVLANTVGLLATSMTNFSHDNDVTGFLIATNEGKAGTEEIVAVGTQAYQNLVNFAKEYVMLKDVGVVDAKGVVRIHSNKDFVGSNIADRSYFKAAMAGKPEAATIVSKATGMLSSSMAIPVVVNGKTLGAVYGTLDLQALASSTTDTVRFGKTGIAFVYDKNGTLLMHPNKKYIGDDDSKLPWLEEMMAHPDGEHKYVWDGKSKMGYTAKVPMVDWLIVLSVEESDIFAPVDDMFTTSSMVGILAMLVVGLIIVLVARNIAVVLRAMAVLMEKIAQGELTLTPSEDQSLAADGRRGDEIGTMARATRGMLEGLRRLFSESEKKAAEANAAAEEARQAVKEAEVARSQAESAKRDGMLAAAERLASSVQIISSASTELTSQIEESERGAERQAARVTETATAMEEMNATVLEVARNAGAAAEVSTSTRQKAENGAHIVEQAVAGIRKVQQESLALKTDMSTLSEHARSIGQIMTVISDIADQTNLLALNAAIEAARAGDAGRGFAVVADEVRKLAEKTMNATSDVGKAIQAIQHSADASVIQVEHAVEAIESATDLANQSGVALTEIVSMVDHTADQVRAIATASEQQSASSEEINDSISQVNAIANETARAMEEAAHAVAELADQAQALNRLIIEMKQG